MNINIDNLYDQQKNYKKRGRPRKNYMSVNIKTPKQLKKPVNNINYNDELILHLPISHKDVQKKSNIDNSSEQYNSIFTSNKESTSKESINKEIVKNKNILTFTDMSDNEKECKLNVNKYNYKNVIKKIPLKIKFINSVNNEQIIQKSTNIACWWCTYTFNTIPCFIPERYFDNKYYVFGCFCSYNCAAAYNLSLNDYKIWDRHSLLNKMYNIFNKINDSIIPAPLKESLIKFGGHISIDEFRNNSKKCNKEYRLIYPMLEQIIPILEERDNNQLNTNNDNIKLKRTKPLPNYSNNLIETVTKQK